MIPATIAGKRYEVEGLLGRGGMGEIYLARDTRLERQVAVKLLARELAHDTRLHARMHREALLAARLSHPSLVAVLDAGEDDGRPFLVMEYVPGETLAARLGRDGMLPPTRVLSLGADLASALAHIHELGMVHRDVKPDNVFLTPDGTVKLGDFGIARALTQPRTTEIGTVLGTASYLAPELLTGADATPPSDVFALGVLLYESASGELPRRGATVSDLSAADTRPLALAVPGAPAELVRVVERCLARDPAARPGAAELAQELLPAEAGAAARVAPVRPTRPLPVPSRAAQDGEGQWGRPSLYRHRRRWLLAGAGLALALVAVAIALAFTLGRGSPPGRSPVTLAPPAAGGNPSLQARNLAAWLLEHADAGSP